MPSREGAGTRASGDRIVLAIAGLISVDNAGSCHSSAVEALEPSRSRGGSSFPSTTDPAELPAAKLPAATCGMRMGEALSETVDLNWPICRPATLTIGVSLRRGDSANRITLRGFAGRNSGRFHLRDANEERHPASRRQASAEPRPRAPVGSASVSRSLLWKRIIG
jgi:hypothetical protein